MTRVTPLERRLEPHAWGEGADFFGPRHQYRESLMMRALGQRLDGCRVLNAGCGAGSMTLALMDKGCHVTSLDASAAFVESLATRLRELHPDAEPAVLVGDVGEMPFEDADFDVVVCGEVLEHLEDDRGAVGELARVLRPGGSLVVSVPANPWRYDWVDHWAGHRRRYTEDGLVDLMLGAGAGANRGDRLGLSSHGSLPQARLRAVAPPKAQAVACRRRFQRRTAPVPGLASIRANLPRVRQPVLGPETRLPRLPGLGAQTGLRAGRRRVS